MNYYQFHIGDFRSGTINMSRHSRWIYRDMMDVYYDSEEPLPLDMDVLCDMLGVCSDDEKEIVRRHLRFKFDMTDAGYTHEVCEKVISEYRAKADVARANGKLGGRPKGNQNKPSGFQSGSYEVSVCKQGETGSQTNHKPLTTNQEPETKNQEQEPVAAKAARVKFDPLTMKPDNVSEQVWAEWAQARSESRKPLTKAMCTAQAKQLAGHANADEVIRKSIAAGWQGLFPDSVKSTSARHSGFDQINYMDGLTVDENGSLRF